MNGAAAIEIGSWRRVTRCLCHVTLIINFQPPKSVADSRGARRGRPPHPPLTGRILKQAKILNENALFLH